MDRLAPLYDLQLALERRPIAAALDLLALRPDDRLLDIGTGTGAVLGAAAPRAGRPAEAIGVDSSRRMLARVGALPGGWRVVCGDATALPFPDGHVSAVSAVYLLHLLDPGGAERAAVEIRRVLGPGGRAVVVVPAVPRGRAAGAFRLLVSALGRLHPSSFGLRPSDPAPALEEAGLTVRRVRYLRRGYPSLCVLAAAPGDRDMTFGRAGS